MWILSGRVGPGGIVPLLASLIRVVSIGAPLMALVNASLAQPAPPGWIEGPRPGCRVWNPQPRPNESVVWTGTCTNGFAQGHGTLVWLQNQQPMDRFSGEYRDGKRVGRGVYIWASGERYEGQYRDDKRTGSGVYTWSNGDRYEGNFRDGVLHGRGVMSWASGGRYDGEWQEGRAHGTGTKTEPDGSVHSGEWIKGCLRNPGPAALAGATREDCDSR